MKCKSRKVIKIRRRWKVLLAIFLIVLLPTIAAAVCAALCSFGKFLQVALPILVFITGICWALRTTNVHQYEATERDMETYIYLYADEMKMSHQRIIENHNQNAKEDLDNARLLSYAALYLSFSVVFLIEAEMFVLLFYHGQLGRLCTCWLATYQCNWPCIFLLSLLVLSLISSAFVCATLFIRLLSKNRAEEKYECFMKCSACFAKYTFILSEDWIKFYRKDDWKQLYRKISKAGKTKELLREREKLCDKHKLTPSENPSGKKLECVIWEDKWLRDLFMKN